MLPVFISRVAFAWARDWFDQCIFTCTSNSLTYSTNPNLPVHSKVIVYVMIYILGLTIHWWLECAIFLSFVYIRIAVVAPVIKRGDWDPITRLNAATYVCFSQAWTWIANVTCRGLLYVPRCSVWRQGKEGRWKSFHIQPTISLEMSVPSQGHYGFFRNACTKSGSLRFL
jgi:hypothetical protein